MRVSQEKVYIPQRFYLPAMLLTWLVPGDTHPYDQYMQEDSQWKARYMITRVYNRNQRCVFFMARYCRPWHLVQRGKMVMISHFVAAPPFLHCNRIETLDKHRKLGEFSFSLNVASIMLLMAIVTIEAFKCMHVFHAISVKHIVFEHDWDFNWCHWWPTGPLFTEYLSFLWNVCFLINKILRNLESAKV